MSSVTQHLPDEPSLNPEAAPEHATLALIDDIQIIPDRSPAALSGPPSPMAGPREAKAPLQGSTLRRHLTIGDVLALTAAWSVALLERSSAGPVRQVVFAAVAVAVTLVAMQRAGLYRSRVCALRSLEAVRVLTASVIGTSAFIACEALVGSVQVASPVAAGGIAVLTVLLLRWRFSRWLKGRRSASQFLRTVVLVGTNEDATGLWTILHEEPELGYRIGAVVGEKRLAAPWAGLPVGADLGRLGDLARQAGANGVIVVASALSPGERSRAVREAQAAGLHVQVWPGLYGFSSRRTRLSPVSGIPLLYVEPKRAPTWGLAVKRAMDIVFAVVIGLLSAPLIAAAALAIKLFEGGPVIHRSDRVGRDGVTIQVLKFRTMVPGAATMMGHVAELNERKGGPLFKASEDPRVTKVGHVLRATSIDELPQLWNVLNGTMSMVGPRPALLHEVEHFDDELRRRHEMRPGITGLWQVEARDNPSFSAYRRHDLSYVDDWSIGLDVAILASTVHELAVRGGRAMAQLVAHRGRRAARAGGSAVTMTTMTTVSLDEAELATGEPA